jgi:type I restriction enzyme, S subunit
VGPWSTTTLAEQAERVQGRVDPKTQPLLPYVGLEHITAGALTLRTTGSSADVTSACFRYQPGDVLFSRLRPYFRKVVRAPGTGLCSTEAWVLRPRSGVDPDFLFYAVANPAFVALCTRSSEGTRMPRARWSYVSQVPLPWPDANEQRRIAAVLRPLDARIDLNRRMNATLQDLVRGLFDRYVLGPAATGAAGWSQGRLGDLATLHRQTVQPGSVPPETPCVGLAQMARGSVALEQWGRAGDADSPKTAYAAGDLLFGRLRPYFKKVAVAPVAGLCSSDVLVVRPRAPSLRALTLSWLVHDPFIAHATAVSTGTRMPRASWRTLADFPVPLPPAGVAAELERSAGPLIDRLTANLRQNQTLAQLRDRVLPGLLSGERRVAG